MESLEADFELLIADWSAFANGDAQPHHGYLMPPQRCKCEMHPWDPLLAGFVSRHCDVFMGLYYGRDAKGEDPLEVDVFIGGYPVCVLSLSPGEKMLAFEGVTFISMISLCMHDVRLRPRCLSSAGDLHLVHARLSEAGRTSLCTETVCFLTPEASRGARTRESPYLRYIHGMCGLSKWIRPADAVAIRLPAFPDPQQKAAAAARRAQAACREQLDRFRDELLQAAWHPSRHVQWCLDTDDLEGLEGLLPSSFENSSRLWYDEVLVISTGAQPAVGGGLEVVRHHDRGSVFRCLQSDGRTWMDVRGAPGRYLALDPGKPRCVFRAGGGDRPEADPGPRARLSAGTPEH